MKRKRNVRAPNAPALKKQKSVLKGENEDNDEDCPEEPLFEKFVVEPRKCFKKQEAQMKQMQEDMKLFIRQEIRAALDPKGKKPAQTKLSHDSQGPTKLVDKAPMSVKKASKRMSTKGRTGTRRSSRLKKSMASDVDIAELSDGGNSTKEELQGFNDDQVWHVRTFIYSNLNVRI